MKVVGILLAPITAHVLGVAMMAALLGIALSTNSPGWAIFAFVMGMLNAFLAGVSQGQTR